MSGRLITRLGTKCHYEFCYGCVVRWGQIRIQGHGAGYPLDPSRTGVLGGFGGMRPWFEGDIDEYTDDEGPDWAFLSFAERFAALAVNDSEEE